MDETHEMTRNIHEIEILWTDELDRGTLEEPKVLLADVGSVVNRLSRDLVDVRFGADDSN